MIVADDLKPGITARRAAPVPLVLVLLALGLAGCTTQPIVPDAVSPSVSELQMKPPLSATRVTWGGTIAGIRNTEAGGTVIEVVARPLKRNGRPLRNDVTSGRFLAEVSEFLDPIIVVVGRDLTVNGGVEEIRDGKIGEASYRFPVVQVSDYRYWKPEAAPPAVNPAHLPHPWPISDRHDDLWHGWPHHPHRHRGTRIHGGLRF